jgi:ATP-dependent Clp protease ATP-binding subunit ClpC
MNKVPGKPEGLGVTEGVHETVYLAREAAQGYSSTQVGTEHLLLGLLQQKRAKRSFVAWCLAEFDVDLRKVRQQLENMAAPDAAAGEEVEFPFTQCSRRVIEQAHQEAGQLGDAYLGAEHLFLGLLEESEGGAAQVFSSLGVDRRQARHTVMRMLGVHSE